MTDWRKSPHRFIASVLGGRECIICQSEVRNIWCQQIDGQEDFRHYIKERADRYREERRKAEDRRVDSSSQRNGSWVYVETFFVDLFSDGDLIKCAREQMADELYLASIEKGFVPRMFKKGKWTNPNAQGASTPSFDP